MEHYKVIDQETGIEKYISTDDSGSTVIVTGVLKPSKINSIAPYKKLQGEVLEPSTPEEFEEKNREYVLAPKKSFRVEPFVNI